MSAKINISGRSYDGSELSADGKLILNQYIYVTQELDQCAQKESALKIAKNAYIAELRNEIIRSKTGIDLSALLSD